MTEETTKLKIVCPFCDETYTADMLIDLESSMGECETCGYDPKVSKIEIKCSSCKKVVYVKEYKTYNF